MRAVLKWFGIVIASVIGLFIVLAIVATIFAPPRQPSQSPPAASTAAAATTKPPAPSPTPVPEPEPPGFKGFGTNVSPKFGLQPGLAIFEMSHDRGRGFEVTLLRAEGDQVEITLYERSPFSLYYEKGPFSVTAVILVEKPQKPQGWRQRGVADPGSYVLNIDADGNWSITLKQTSLDSVADPPQTFRGKGMAMSPPFMLKEGLVTFSFTHDGKSEFAVVLLSVPAIPGGKREPLVIKSGSFEGSKAVGVKGDAGVKAGIYVLEISADGNWTVTISR